MDYQQKMLALMAICPDASVRLGTRDHWYLHLPGVEIKDGGMLRSGALRGENPAAAIDRAWSELTDKLPGEAYLVTRAMSPNRRAFRWQGFMWAEVEEVKRGNTMAGAE